MTQHILIVEDELSIVTLLKYNLEQAGFTVDTSFDGEDAIKKITSHDGYDLVVLDVMLPKFDGLQVCQYVRNEGKQVPILMVTAMNQEEDIVTGLNSGADDYITKPFSPKVLIARIHALLRRTDALANTKSKTLTLRDLTIYPDRFEVYFKQELLTLTRKEFELLLYFMKNKDLVLARDQLLHAVWDYNIAGDTRIVDVHVARLREKIEEDKKNPQYIMTIHGFGYKMA